SFFHVGEALRPGLRQPVVLARMRRFALHPFRVEQAFAGEPAENRIDRAFADDKIGEGFKVLNDGETVARSGRDRQQDGQVETAAPKLLLPGVERHTLCHKASTRPRVKMFGGRINKKAGGAESPPAFASHSSFSSCLTRPNCPYPRAWATLFPSSPSPARGCEPSSVCPARRRRCCGRRPSRRPCRRPRPRGRPSRPPFPPPA